MYLFEHKAVVHFNESPYEHEECNDKYFNEVEIPFGISFLFIEKKLVQLNKQPKY